MNKGKCESCQKTVYDQEGLTIGPHSEYVYHNRCFVCANPGCTWKLNYSNYCFADGKPYCKNHNPMTGTSNTAARAASRSNLAPRSSPREPAPAAAPKGQAQFCGSCGTKADEEGSAFCGSCGSKLD